MTDTTQEQAKLTLADRYANHRNMAKGVRGFFGIPIEDRFWKGACRKIRDDDGSLMWAEWQERYPGDDGKTQAASRAVLDKAQTPAAS